MLKSFFVMAFAVFAFVAPATAMKAMDHDTAKPTVAIFYADWCGSCKVMEPKMNEAISQLNEQSALTVVKFDLTNEETKTKAASMAAEHGLTDLYNAKAPKTGFAILVNESGNNPMTITKADSVEVIKAKLETYIATKS